MDNEKKLDSLLYNTLILKSNASIRCLSAFHRKLLHCFKRRNYVEPGREGLILICSFSSH